MEDVEGARDNRSAPPLDLYRRIQEFCAGEDLDCVDLYPTFRKSVADNRRPLFIADFRGHWGAEGNLLAAEVVVRHLLQSGLVQNSAARADSMSSDVTPQTKQVRN